MPPQADRRLAGIRRFMAYHPSDSAVHCQDCGEKLGVRLSAKKAGRLARDHTRDTGHETQAWHTQVVTYRRDTS